MSIVMNQVSVGTAATFVGYIPPAGYMAALGTSPVYLGTGSAVTVSTGFQVPTATPLVWQNALAAPAVPVYAVAASPSQNLSFGFGNGPAGQVIAGGTAALQLDRNSADIQPVGVSGTAGASGLAADAKHVHMGMSLLASTGGTGYTLINGTGTIISWTAPNDGALHRVVVASSMFVASTETGGLIQAQWTGPGAGAAQNSQIFAAALAGATSSYSPSLTATLVIAPNTSFLVRQASALTGGTATLYAEIWGS